MYQAGKDKYIFKDKRSVYILLSIAHEKLIVSIIGEIFDVAKVELPRRQG